MLDTIYFRGLDEEIPLVKKLSQGEDGNPYGRGLRRLAPAFVGDFEPCKRVVLLPGVNVQDADRITAVYGAKGIPVLRFAGPLPDLPPPEPIPDPIPAPVLVPDAKTKTLSNAQLRRMPTRALLNLAEDRGIDVVGIKDRASLIATIEAGKRPSLA